MAVAEETMGQRIKAQRKARHMTQEELAEALVLSKDAISSYENDKNDIPSKRLGELARVLHTTPDYLLGFEKRQDPLEMEVNSLLQEMSDERIKMILLAQMKVAVNTYKSIG